MGKPAFTGFTELNRGSMDYHVIFVMLTVRDTVRNVRNTIGEKVIDVFANRFIHDYEGRTFFKNMMQNVIIVPDALSRNGFTPFAGGDIGASSAVYHYSSELRRASEPGNKDGKKIFPPSNRELIGLLYDHYEVVRDGLGYGRSTSEISLFDSPFVDMKQFRDIFRHSKEELPILVDEVIRRTDRIPYQFYQGEIRLVREVQRYENHLRTKRDVAKGRDLGFDPDNGCFSV
ncbi:hypothetical protein HFQ13_06600 [Acidithiobacillus sp. VAN18-1]|uniref:Uncharacterized protein n=1 Tax=Igneacidithiobacillus copahuensis TaxID=2724909 RepID=A0AAE2YPX1_9PROT|nr:hypothetical protein [Igneacidithiobacillus copahuensis]MBU2787873.1 hypothetical protein [Igneacidithiobacillus copahuensis]MBU2795489.1 hypothetical protein [Acidithiobacillus sp. VAN18-2]